ncbi:hypothetical protein [Nocardiopsis sp. CA-288880]|uniref:hypothetical protein n=1 Tax=Nocardiopsis sp. CA-288880 TaxID=3239995 RepID=UPI003D99F2E0
MREHDETAAPADGKQSGVRRTPRAQEREDAGGRMTPGTAGVRRPPAEEVPEQRRRGGVHADPARAAGPAQAAPPPPAPDAVPGAARAVAVDAEVSDPAPSPPDARAPAPAGSAPSGPRGAEDPAGRSGPRGMDPGDVRERWQETQGGFVDDPRGTVREADALAAEVADAVIAGIEARRAALRSAWSEGDGSDTESLRLALRDYRSFVERLVDAGR